MRRSPRSSLFRRRPLSDIDLPGDRDISVPFDYVPTPEEFEPSPPRTPSPMAWFPPLQDLLPALMCFLLFWLVSGRDWQLPQAQGWWVSGESVFQGHEYWRLITALFAHADLGHLLSNSLLFVIFGWFLYAFFGPLTFPFGAVGIGVLSNLVTIYFYAPQTALLGASGMLYGMVALWLVLYVRFETSYGVLMRIFRSVGVSLLLLFPTTFHATTSYTAHISGFIIGILWGLLLLGWDHLSHHDQKKFADSVS